MLSLNGMNEKRYWNKKIKKMETDMDLLIESNAYLGFIAGYTSNGVPYGLTHEEWEAVNSETEIEKMDNVNIDLPF